VSVVGYFMGIPWVHKPKTVPVPADTVPVVPLVFLYPTALFMLSHSCTLIEVGQLDTTYYIVQVSNYLYNKNVPLVLVNLLTDLVVLLAQATHSQCRLRR
jgi:hypothetical protein